MKMKLNRIILCKVFMLFEYMDKNTKKMKFSYFIALFSAFKEG